MKVRALKLQDEAYGDQWSSQIEDHWEYADFKANERWRRGWISMDCALYSQPDDRVYLGITSFDADIFRAYNRPTGEFVDLGYERIADPFDAKFHRSLEWREKDGCLYGAIALLHDVDRFWEAPGGALVRYDPTRGDLEKIAIPIPHLYIQSICLDPERDLIYGFTFTPERLFRYHLATGQTDDLGPISSGFGMAQGENIVLDDEGRAWCGWSVTRAWQNEPGVDANRLCRIGPDQERIEFLDAGLPRLDGQYGYDKAEGLFSLGTGSLYASGVNGSLYRIDPDSGMGTHLATPIADRRSRLASLVLGPDGKAYGVTGRDGECEVLCFDPRTEKHELLGPVVAGEERCWQVHDVAITGDGVLYAGENDVPHRSGYLWEITL